MSKEYTKPPIIYQGNKFRLIKKIAPLFPKDINEKIFVDAFGGSGAMSINFGEQSFYNDSNEFITKLVQNSLERTELLSSYIIEFIEHFKLDDKTDKEQFIKNYLNFREYINNIEFSCFEHIAGIYTLHLFSINNLIRFNKNKKFNASQGHHDKSVIPKNRLNQKNKPMVFVSLDFEEFVKQVIKGKTTDETFFYFDPPYTGTTAVYNENKLTSWNLDEDIRLFKLLDLLNEKGYKWAMSNTLTTKDGLTKAHLQEWANKYNINYLDTKYASFGHSNQNNQEVLITNYEE